MRLVTMLVEFSLAPNCLFLLAVNNNHPTVALHLAVSNCGPVQYTNRWDLHEKAEHTMQIGETVSTWIQYFHMFMPDKQAEL